MQTPANTPRRIITHAVWMLSLVSLFTDMASEMLYPIMPLFLKQIGFTVIFIGFLEGLAEAVAGLSKPYFGKLSDATGKRLPFVQWGYGLSALSKPMMALFIFPLWIFFARTIDRLGKGIRTGARDALLSDEATPATKATVFGFHRSMDTLGAVIGPALALIYLYFYPHQYRAVFLIAFCPGVFALLCSFAVKQKNSYNPKKLNAQSTPIFSFFSYLKNSPRQYQKLLGGLLLFSLFNSSDMFLLLKVKAGGLSDTAVIGVYIFYNLIFALLSFPIGIVADKLGIKKIFLAGLFIFSIVYVGFAFNKNLNLFILLFALYGLYAAATDGIAKAWISNITDKNQTATAIGTYTGLQSIAALLASSLCGLLWYYFGAAATFIITACVALIAMVYLYFLTDKQTTPV